MARNKNLTEDYFVSSFISGLQEHIKGAVKMFRPQNLVDTVFPAKQAESKAKIHAPTMTKPYTKTVSSTVVEHRSSPVITSAPKPTFKSNKPKSTLNSKEIMERRAKGLCFHFDDSYHPGKECKSRLYSMLGEDDSVQQDDGVNEVVQEIEYLLTEEVTPAELSLNAMAGHQSFSTVRLQGRIKKQPVSILVDSGSTHSFIDAALVKKLGLVAEVIPPLVVTVADGTQSLVDTACKDIRYDIQGHSFCSNLRLFSLGASDMVLGVDWLREHNPVTFDFQEVNIAIQKEGNPLILQGEKKGSNIQTISCKKLNKLLQQPNNVSQGFLCLIQAGQDPITNLTTPGKPLQNILPQLQELVDEYSDIFKEPEGHASNSQT